MKHSVTTIDCDYLYPEFAAAYLRVAGDECAFIEANTEHALPTLLAALAASGLRREQVRYVIVTHAHLDHAAGAGALMLACPNASLVAHPRAARHLIDPARLVASATSVYGAPRFQALYGSVSPIDEARVRVLDDGGELVLGDATLHALHTRGHANHHFVVHDPALDTVYTGDAFGLVLPALQRARPFAFPSTSPTDFDPMEARFSVDRILALKTRSARPTHFGEVTALADIGAQLHSWIDLSESLLVDATRTALSTAELVGALSVTLREAFTTRSASSGLALSVRDWAMLALDIDLNAQGIAWVAQKRRNAKLA